ncbi:MAG: DUF1194 domain-containing protein [Litoreibacter sp.]|nr:DUF1194 domain-containing protein [Litoreibacter sp.]
MFQRAAAIAISFGLMAVPAKACEVALVLAVDISGSISTEEYRLQMDGLAEALRDPTVSDALVETRATLSLMQWTGSSRQTFSIPWTQITTRADVAELAERVVAVKRAWLNYSTAIGEALLTAASRFAEVPECERNVIDVSGDGYSNEGDEPGYVRDFLASNGVTINGLAIEGAVEDLTSYFRSEVIGGPGAFVLTSRGYEDYPRAIRRKLLTEITKPSS